MEFIVVAILIGLVPASIARNKGRSFGLWWFYGAAVFIVALPHALIMKPDPAGVAEQAMKQGQRKCPFCAELVQEEAIVCKHCGRDLTAQPSIRSF